MRADKHSIIRPELTVAAIVEYEGRFLLVEELVQGCEVINQPAGHVEAGESLIQAVIRETLEETAWTFEPHAMVGIYLWQRPDGRSPFLRVAFAGTISAHDRSRQLDGGIIRVLWLSRADLLARTPQLRSPMVLRGVDDYLRGARYPVDLVQDFGIEQLARRAAVL